MDQTINFQGMRCSVQIGYYQNRNIRIQLYDMEDGMPAATASTNIAEKMQPNEVIIKDFSENKGIYQALLNENIILPAHRYIQTGYESSPVAYLAPQL